jgi:CRISPR-associated protein Cas2
MWVLVLFDLPVDTKAARREYARFRKRLLKDGFMMLQYSVYGRHCPSHENAAVHINRVHGGIPPDGEVRVITVTDRQFERMQVFLGNRRASPEKVPKVLTLF